LIDRQGEVFTPKVLADNIVSLPLFRGEDSRSLQVFEQCRAFQGVLSKKDLLLRECTQDSSGGWRLGLAGDMRVVLGASHVLQRLDTFAEYYQKVVSKFSKPVTKVDLRYRHGFAVSF
jgi:cell division protein FtsQ